MHELSGVSKTGESAEFGPGGHRHRALHPAQGLEGVDHWGQPPGLYVGVQFLCQTRKPFGVCGDGSDVCLEHHLLGWGGTDHRAEPPQVRGIPGGPACIPDVLSQETRLEPKFGRLAIAQGIFTGAAQGPDGFILHPGDVDRGQVPRAQQAGQLARVTTVRCAPSARLLGEQRWSPPQQP